MYIQIYFYTWKDYIAGDS